MDSRTERSPVFHCVSLLAGGATGENDSLDSLNSVSRHFRRKRVEGLKRGSPSSEENLRSGLRGEEYIEPLKMSVLGFIHETRMKDRTGYTPVNPRQKNGRIGPPTTLGWPRLGKSRNSLWGRSRVRSCPADSPVRRETLVTPTGGRAVDSRLVVMWTNVIKWYHVFRESYDDRVSSGAGIKSSFIWSLTYSVGPRLP